MLIVLFLIILLRDTLCFMLPSTTSTVANYDGRIQSFSSWAFGSEALEAQRIRKLFTDQLGKVNNSPSNVILDVGCGPGRDLEGFLNSNFDVIGIEPSQMFCDTAVSLLSSKFSPSRFMVMQGDICDASLIHNMSDKQVIGAFCLASLFHIPYSKLASALENIRSLLVPGGLILSSFPIRMEALGLFKEGITMPDGRWSTGLSVRQHSELLTSHNFSIVQSFTCNIYNGNWSCIIAQKN